MKKNVAIIILIAIVLGLSGYLIFALASNATETKEDNNYQKEDKPTQDKIDEKDSSYFEEYLYYFMPRQSANNFVRDIDIFSDGDIKTYLLFYYMNRVNSYELQTDSDGSYTYTVSKKEVTDVVNKYFGITDFEISNDVEERDGIKELDDDNYQVYWFATGWMASNCELTSVIYEGKNVKVTGRIYETEGTIFKENSEIVFNLVYNDGDYNLKSIEYNA